MYLKDLQNILQNLKLDERITLEKIGLALGVTKSTISTRIKNKSKLRPDEIKKIEDYFKVNISNVPEWLLDDRSKFQKFFDEKLTPNIDLTFLADLFGNNNKQLPEDSKQILLESVKQVWSLTDEDLEVVSLLLDNENTRTITKMLFNVLRGNEEVKEVLIGILNLPELAKTFIK